MVIVLDTRFVSKGKQCSLWFTFCMQVDFRETLDQEIFPPLTLILVFRINIYFIYFMFVCVCVCMYCGLCVFERESTTCRNQFYLLYESWKLN